MTQNDLSLVTRLRLPLILLFAAGLLFLIATWGGSTASGPQLFIGIGILIGLFLVFGLAIRWLYFSPIKEEIGEEALTGRTAAARQFVVLLVALSGMSAAIGGMWDQAWHQIYGGFGDDFLWPPHMLIYAGLGAIALFALGGMVMLGRGKGGLRARFRREPHIGLLALASVYIIISIPSDAFWHVIYGPDLTAWSLPHILLASVVVTIMLAALALQLSIIPRRDWAGLRGIRWQELAALAPLFWALAMLVQVGIADWDARTLAERSLANPFSSAFWSRPEWLYPVVVAFCALLVGNLTLHAVRRAGAATILAGLGALWRLVSVAAVRVGAPDIQIYVTHYLLPIAPLAVMDIWYGTRLAKAEETSTLHIGNLVATAAYLLAGLPLISATMEYPRVNTETLPGMIGFSLLMGIVGGWAGARLGRWLGNLGQRPAETVPVRGWVGWATAGVLVTALAAIVVYMLIAPTPA